jgi:membrane-anchored mycosin MYCP
VNRHAVIRAAALPIVVLTICSLGVGPVTNPAVVLANPSSVDPSMVPPDGPPGPDQAMRQRNTCARATIAAQSDISEPAGGFAMLDIASAWRYSTGNGVTVAVIDTGVTPTPRLPVLPGGDYITGGDGLSDCDSHGTIVASVIAAAPQGIPDPRPMPPHPAPRPAPAPTPGATGDGVAGVAPHATLISIRQSSRAFEPGPGSGAERTKAGTLATLARAVVHAANLGADVINISVASCFSPAEQLDQRSLGAAVWYAATVKDAVVVAAAGNEGEDGCGQNPPPQLPDPGDPRDWRRVRTISSPSWFADNVLSVGALDLAGNPIAKTLAGPWVAVAAPGVAVTGLSPQGGSVVNAYAPARPGEAAVPFWGTSFAAAYVSGVAALVRAKYPNLAAREVINRIQQTCHNPPGGVDNRVGFGLVDPVAALTFDVETGDRAAPTALTEPLRFPPPPAQPDHRAHRVAIGVASALAVSVALAATITRARRRT